MLGANIVSISPALVSTAPETTMRDVMQAFNVSQYPFRLVLDGAGKLLGTITDGDVRRALLTGAGLDSPATTCMQRNPVIGRKGDRWEDVGKPRGVNFLPVVDANDVVQQVLVASDQAPAIATALVMAGGKGRRLGDRTRHTPKPLLTVRGKPILEHILAKIEAAGVPEVFVSVHYLPERIEEFLADRESRSKIATLHETEMLGTAGAVTLLPAQNGAVLVMNGDVISEVNLAAFAQFHAENGNDLTACIATYRHKIPFGVVRHDQSGAFSGVDEKPERNYPILAGIYLFSPKALAIAPRGRAIDMPDLMTHALEMGLRVGTFPLHEYWIDVGRPADLEAAQRGPEAGN